MYGVRKSSTNNNGDIDRRKILQFIKDNPWCSRTEIIKATKIGKNAVHNYVNEFSAINMLVSRTRKQFKEARPPIEYIFQDRWEFLQESNEPLIQEYLNRYKRLADIYRTGNIPTEDSLDEVNTDLGNKIMTTVDLLELLNMVYEDPAMRKVNEFVKRMDSL